MKKLGHVLMRTYVLVTNYYMDQLIVACKYIYNQLLLDILLVRELNVVAQAENS